LKSLSSYSSPRDFCWGLRCLTSWWRPGERSLVSSKFFW
jgi:hypothetical protein